MKSIVINFSELNEEAKRKYLRFLADNNINIENQIKKPSQHRTRQYSTLSDIANSRAFTPAKQIKQVHLKTETNPSAKFQDLEDSYPRIMAKISNKDLLSRPLKLSLNELLLLIEEIYQKKFNDDQNQIAKNQKMQEIQFVDYVNDFLFAKVKKAQHIINFLASVDLHALKRKDVLVFQQFLRQHKQEVLTFFLFTRAVIQKELKTTFYHPLKKSAVDCNTLLLNSKQVQQLSILLYSSPDRYIDFRKYFVGTTLSVSEFFYAALTIYEVQHQTHKQKPFQTQQRSYSPMPFATTESVDFKQPESPLFMNQVESKQEPFFTSSNYSHNTSQTQQTQSQNHNTQRWKVQFKFKKLGNPINGVQKQINSTLEIKLSDFIEDILSEMEDLSDEQKKQCITGIGERIEDTVVALLDAIYKFDKLIWFKKLNQQPNENGLEYIENLQKQYRALVKAQSPDTDQLEQICLMMMQTPDLAKRIGNELLQYFQ